MSCGEPTELLQSMMAYNMAAQIDNEVYSSVYTKNHTQTTTTGAVGSNYNNWDTSIKMGNGVLCTDNTGSLTWNGYPVAPGEAMKSSVRNLTEMLKDDTLKKIILCKSKEECKEEFGKYGLEIYDSLLKDVLEAGIKSEESFNVELQKEKEKVIMLKKHLTNYCKDDQELKEILLQTL